MISTRNLTKSFGSLVALDALTLDIGPGEIFGFIGPNGAGKSTTMKILAGLTRPTSGKASVAGLDCETRMEDIRRVIGYMPDFLGVYDDLTVHEYLGFFAAAFKIPRIERAKTIDGVLELTDLREKRDAMVDSLSRGMQQRLGVARVLLHDPKVLLLDEPASGLDPRARIEMRSLLQELGRMGKTLMVSSHILSELGEMSTCIGIIERGRLLYFGSMADAFKRTRELGGHERVDVLLRVVPGGQSAQSIADRLTLSESIRAARVVKSPPNASVAALAESAVVSSSNGAAPEPSPFSTVEGLEIELHPGVHDHGFVIDEICKAGGRILRFDAHQIKLEDAFLKLTTGALQ